MDYVKPAEVVETMVVAGGTKELLPAKDLLIRGILSGALLGFATSLAVTATVQTNVPLVGALIFPVGFVMIVLLGLELATGSFALLPLAVSDHKLSTTRMLTNFGWVLLGNLIGSLLYAVLLARKAGISWRCVRGTSRATGKSNENLPGAKIRQRDVYTICDQA